MKKINRYKNLCILVIINILFHNPSWCYSCDLSQGDSRVIYIGKSIIDNAYLVNKDGLGFLISQETLETWDLKENKDVYIAVCDFKDRNVYPAYSIIIFGMNPNVLNTLIHNKLYNPIDPEFKFYGTKKGCEIYKNNSEHLKVLLFLVQIDYLNTLLNPIYDLKQGMKIKKRLISSAFPLIEYVKVAIPTE